MVKAMVFPVVMYAELDTKLSAEELMPFFFFCSELMLLNCGVGEDA